MDTNQKENVIEIDSLVKRYKMYNRKKDRLIEAIIPRINRHTDFLAINNLNLTVKKGEILGILGKNGAGKSTLLKMITGVVTPTQGELKVNGKISSLLELGAAFNMELTGEENIYQHGQVMGLTKEEIEKTKQDIINFADIGDHLYQPVKTYSSGMFARLAFACAINVDPDILIVDEVLSVGDMAFQLKCFKKFEQFKSKGKTILFVTHNIGDVIDNCSRVIILNKGQKIFDGETKEGVETYKKLITGMLKDKSEEQEMDKEQEVKQIVKDDKLWKNNFNLNPDMIIYGNNEAEIYDYGIFNSKGEFENVINNDDEISVKLKARFNKDVECPTFSMTIKDFTGKEICGTNTNIQKLYTGKCIENHEYICEFKQKMRLAPGKYTMSLSCSKYNMNGELVPINRNYDALIFEVISKKPVVGYYELDTQLDFKEIK
ncbi:MAG: ABC transporter ATP-binding protein [Clostridia bacterium]|nr:ABC transporter ATP-binding protein [Clostridia bacterium]